MYVVVFVLYFLERGSIIGEASSRTKNNFQEMLRKGGRGWEEPADQLYHSPRRERESDKVVPLDTEWKPEDYAGIRSEAIVSIENDGVYTGYDLRLAYGVRLQERMVLTVCSAVTYVDPPKYRLDYWDHTEKHYPVTKCRARDIHVFVMTTKNLKKAGVRGILIHPMCDNQYEVDLAVVVTEPIPDSKNVWVHTAENLLFRRNLDRVVAAQAVLGKCSVPVYSKSYSREGPGRVTFAVEYVRVHFQNWDGCKETLCPYWDPHPGQRKHQDPRRCNNLLNGTRYCMAWTIPDESLCDLLPGTPIFCDVGQIHGIMGFLLRETYKCWPFVNKNAVMQGLNDGIAWMRGALQIIKSGSYEDGIPEWMRNLRERYIEDVTPRFRPRKKKKPSPDITFQNFAGQQFLSIVNVYVKETFLCRGTLVTAEIVVMPCSCISFHKLNMSLDENIDGPHPVATYDYVGSRISVSLMVNGSLPRVRMIYVEKHKFCDSHFFYDSAWGQLDDTLPVFKLAWLMTPNNVEFARMLMITAVADSSMGHDCYYLDDVSFRDKQRIQEKIIIRFVHWTRCIHNICPTDRWKRHQKPRCYGLDDPTPSTTYCIESDDTKAPACDITNGTPIFCNVEQARGLVGFVTTAMDLNPIPCLKREVANQTAVFQGIDQLLPQFKEYTWIHKFAEIGEDLKARSRGFSRSVIPRRILITIVLIITLCY